MAGEGLSPAAGGAKLSKGELDHLRRVLRAATRDAIRKGGVHTGDFIEHRRRGAPCPRCQTTLERDTIGGRTTFWSRPANPDDGLAQPIRHQLSTTM